MNKQRSRRRGPGRTDGGERRRRERVGRDSSRRRRYSPAVEDLEGRQLLSAFAEYPIPLNNSDPGDLTVGPDGNLWFPYGNSYNGTGDGIGRITPSGTVTLFPDYAGQPGDLTVGSDGNLWFPDLQGIGRITPSGSITEFSLPSGSLGTGKLTLGPDGNLWFPEPFGFGNVIGRITTSGAVTLFPLPDANNNPGDLTDGPDGNLWFPCQGNPSSHTGFGIGRITTSGAIEEFPLPSSDSPSNHDPGDLTDGPDGNLWFPDFQSISRITPSGVVTEFPVPNALNFPGDLTVGPDGNLWFPESSSSRIGRITTSGTVTDFPLPSSVDDPSDLTDAPDGNLWFPVAGGVGRISTLGDITVFQLPDASASPGNLTVGPNGDLWFPENDVGGIAYLPVELDGRIGEVDPSQLADTGVVAVQHSRKAVRSITLGFEGDLDPSLAGKRHSYSLTAGIQRHHSLVFAKAVKIGKVSYNSTNHTVRLKLARPRKGPIQVTIGSGVVEAGGTSDLGDFTAVVE